MYESWKNITVKQKFVIQKKIHSKKAIKKTQRIQVDIKNLKKLIYETRKKNRKQKANTKKNRKE